MRKIFLILFVFSLLFGLSLILGIKIGNQPDELIDFESPLIFQSEPKPIRVVFVGDIMLSRAVDRLMKKNNNYQFPFLRSAEFFQTADIVFGNLEGPISDQGENLGSIYSFRADPRVIEGLKLANFNVLSLANNHILDWGRRALVQTIELLKQNNIYSVGAGRNYLEANQPVIIEKSGIKFAFLAFTNLYPESLKADETNPGISDFDLTKVKGQIKELKQSGLAEVMVVSLHWGEEYKQAPSPEQIRIAHELAEAGADFIIGHHPHVVQREEKYPSISFGTSKISWIFYSLGNFVFDQNFSEETMNGLVVELIFKSSQDFEPKLYQAEINDYFQPEIKEF
ncbi:MAG: CapA family protein [Patescibacteria group bacterium]